MSYSIIPKHWHLFLSCLSAFFGTLLADLPSITESYGLYNGVLDNYKHCSPFHGLVLAETEKLRNYYEFSPDKDPMGVLIRELFFLQGDTFKITTLPAKPASKFNINHMSIILAHLEAHMDNGTGFCTIDRNALKIVLFNALGGKEFSHKLSDLLRILLNALEAAGYFGLENQIYPQFLVHNILQTFLYNKITTKDDYKRYFAAFENITAINGGKGILNPDQSWWPLSYQNPSKPETLAAVIFEDLKKYLESLYAPDPEISKLLNPAISHYESFGYAGIYQEKYSSPYPRYLSWGRAFLQWYKNRPATQKTVDPFSDCVETAIRNTLDLLLYNKQTRSWDVTRLNSESIAASYYATFGPFVIGSQAARDSWADRVSNIPGIEYLRRAKREKDSHVTIEKSKIEDGTIITFTKPTEDDDWYYYEVSSGIPNIVKVLNHVLNTHFTDLQDFMAAYKATCALATKEQNTLCTITSEQGKQCTLNVGKGHSEVAAWHVSRSLIFNPEFLNKVITQNPNDRSILPIINFYRLLTNTFGQSLYLRHILLSDALDSINNLIHIIKDFIFRHTDWLTNHSWYYQFIKKLINKVLSLHDPETTRRLIENLSREDAASIPIVQETINQAIEQLNANDLSLMVLTLITRTVYRKNSQVGRPIIERAITTAIKEHQYRSAISLIDYLLDHEAIFGEAFIDQMLEVIQQFKKQIFESGDQEKIIQFLESLGTIKGGIEDEWLETIIAEGTALLNPKGVIKLTNALLTHGWFNNREKGRPIVESVIILAVKEQEYNQAFEMINSLLVQFGWSEDWISSLLEKVRDPLAHYFLTAPEKNRNLFLTSVNAYARWWGIEWAKDYLRANKQLLTEQHKEWIKSAPLIYGEDFIKEISE